MNHFIPLKALQFQKRYICWGLFDTQESKTHKFIYRLNYNIFYLKHFPLFRTNQGITNNKIVDIIKSALTYEWQTHLINQGFNSNTKILGDLVELFDILETV